MSIEEQKEKLRGRLLQKRESLPASYYNQASEDIIVRLQTLPEFRSSRIINCYVSMNQRREVDTHSFLRWMLASNKRVVVPVTEFDPPGLRHVELRSFDDLETNKWGVLEPNDGKPITPSEFDFVIVPMVGADPNCNRLGYGKGFYDRFLAKVDCPAVGLCFEKCVVEAIPTEHFDVQLSAVVTEKRILKQ